MFSASCCRPPPVSHAHNYMTNNHGASPCADYPNPAFKFWDPPLIYGAVEARDFARM